MRAILTTWNLGPVPWGGATLSADIEAKLQRLTTVDYDHKNLSWLLDPSRPLKPSAILRVPALSKNQLGRPRFPGHVVSAKRKRAQRSPHNLKLPKR